MSATSVNPLYPIFTDTDGQPLENGYIWIGTVNLDPQGNPINVYWDSALTQVAGQPIRTINGYPSRNGSPSRLFVNSEYSIRVQNKNGTTVASVNNNSEALGDINSALVTFIQSGTGAVSRTVQSKLRDTVSVKDFGADPAASAAVNTAAIQAAADYAASTGAYLVGAPGVFNVSATISLQCNGDLGEMTIEANTASVSPIVRFGTTSGAATSYKIITLPRVRNSNRTAGTWGAGIGIELANCNTNTITIPSATECEIGVTCGGYNSGFAYNNVTLMFLYSNKVNLRLRPAGSGGWCNQNVFTGGRLGVNSADFTTSGYVGTRDILLDKGATSSGGPNNNTFINTSIETDLLEYMIAFEESSAYNQFINCRYEGTNSNVLFNTSLVVGHSSNLFIGGYQAQNIAFTFTGAGTSAYNSAVNGRTNSIDSSGYCFNLVNQSGGAVANPHIQGFNAGQLALSKDNSSTDWVYRLYATGLDGKRSTDAYARLTLDYANGRFYAGNGTAAPTRYMGAFGSLLGSASDWVPHSDNTYNLGSATYRWGTVYAGTGTINTSDERAKQDIAALDAAEKRVAVALKGLVKKFRFKDAVQAKGDDARIHVGVIAQEVIAAFQAENLDPMRYGIVCYDQWDAEDDRPAGDRYGVRYEELLAFIIASI